MHPIEFKEQNCIYAKDQPQYLPLPCHKREDGEVISCWKFTFKEKLKILFGKPLWLSILTFNQRLQPQRPSIDYPLTTKLGGAKSKQMMNVVRIYLVGWYVKLAKNIYFQLGERQKRH